ncbi:MAG: hypothetical protein WAS51_14520 [Ilumatobacteraceae bacterium]
MPSIRVLRFGGIRPALTDKHLAGENATVAHNCELRDGSLRPFKKPLLVRTEDYDIKAIHRPYSAAACCPAVRTWDHCVSVTHPPLPGECSNFAYYLAWHHGCKNTPADRVDPCSSTTWPLVVPHPAFAPRISLAKDTDQDNNHQGALWNYPGPDQASGATQDPFAVEYYQGPDARSYVYTWVDIFGIESAPSPPSQQVLAYDTQWWQISGFDTPPPNAVCMRLYRTSASMETGSRPNIPLQTSFQLVDELPLPIAGNTYIDQRRLVDIAWGTLQTIEQCDPPCCFEQVIEVESSFHVAFRGNTIWVSERHEPHNWPEKGRVELPHRIIGLANNLDRVYIATTGQPYRMNVAFAKSGDTADYVVEPVAFNEMLPCLQQQTMVPSTRGAMYLSKRGLVHLMETGPAVVATNQRFDEDNFLQYAGNIAAWFRGKYVMTRSPVGRGVFVDFKDNSEGVLELGDIVTADLDADVLHAGSDDRLYFSKGPRLYTWDEGYEPMTYRWRSKIYRFDQVTSLAAFKVVGQFGPPVKFRLWASGRLVHEREVTRSCPLRLPSFGRHIEYQFELEGTTRIDEVHLATSVAELSEPRPLNHAI